MQRPGSFCIWKEKTPSFHFLFSHKRHLDAYYVYCAQNKSVCKYQMANAFQCTFSRKLKPVSSYTASVIIRKSKTSVNVKIVRNAPKFLVCVCVRRIEWTWRTNRYLFLMKLDQLRNKNSKSASFAWKIQNPPNQGQWCLIIFNWFHRGNEQQHLLVLLII